MYKCKKLWFFIFSAISSDIVSFPIIKTTKFSLLFASISFPILTSLMLFEKFLYKTFSNSISGVKIGKLIDTNNNENFVVLVIGNETMTDEISEKIKNLEFNTEKKYEIIIEKNKQEKVNAISKENQK